MGKSLVTLMRHAKSSWQGAGQADHDRPLNARGMKDAPLMAQRLIDNQCIPDLIICSSATRAQQTGDCLMGVLQLADRQFQTKPELYLASPETLLSILKDVEHTINHVLLIAHNPGLAQLSNALAPDASPQMPTAAIRHFSWPDPDDLNDHEPILIFEDYPKNPDIQ